MVTVGGYHPRFQRPARYPIVPRLGFSWRVTDELSLKGDVYYALTASAVMAGGHLEAVWERAPYKAWFKAGIDCLISWKPVAYDARAYVEVGASYTFELAGTRHITVEVGADVHVWGPPFSGTAHVNLGIVSFDLSFGSSAPEKEPISLAEFQSSFLPAGGSICGVSVQGGLVRSFDGDTGVEWIVNPKELCLVTDSAVPSKEILLGKELHETAVGFGVAPMDADASQVSSARTTISIHRLDGATPLAAEKHFKGEKAHFDEAKGKKGKKVPAALWGQSMNVDPNVEQFIDALCGLTLRPSSEPDCGATATWPGDEARKEAGTITLLQRHRPPLPSGTYQIMVEQELVVKSQQLLVKPGTAGQPDTKPKATRRFHVAGEQVSLPPSCIHSVFPPQGSLGDHSATLPHVILTRSTLPWERSAERGKDTPWLALLVFSDEEKPVPAIIRGSDYEDLEGFQSALKSKGLPSVDFLDRNAAITVIEVKAELLAPADKLALLCHVRKSGSERAVVVANRLPETGKRSTVHLVSVEGRYKDGALGTGKGETIHLVSLWSWSFSSVDAAHSFSKTVEKLDKSWFRLPDKAGLSDELLAAGYVPLPHALKSGEVSVSRYRGPLVPGAALGAVLAPLTSPAQADISYAAAKELGRLLALQSKPVSVGLFRWKRALSHHRILDSQRGLDAHLYPGGSSSATGAPAMPKEVSTWLEGLRKLEHVPFRYTLPDERLLPEESIRFFVVDPAWIKALLDGAASVGGPGGEDDEAFALDTAVKTGVLVRSSIVAGWPDLAVSAGEKGDVMPFWKARLAKNTLLVLFDGKIDKVTFSVPNDTLHFDLTRDKDHKLKVDNRVVDITAGTSVELAALLLAKAETVECIAPLG